MAIRTTINNSNWVIKHTFGNEGDVNLYFEFIIIRFSQFGVDESVVNVCYVNLVNNLLGMQCR